MTKHYRYSIFFNSESLNLNDTVSVQYKINGSFSYYLYTSSTNIDNSSKSKLIEGNLWSASSTFTMEFDAPSMLFPNEATIGTNASGDKFVAPSQNEMYNGNYSTWHVPNPDGSISSNYFTYVYAFDGIASMSYFDSSSGNFSSIDLENINVVSTTNYTDPNGASHTVVNKFTITATLSKISHDIKPFGLNTKYSEQQFS